jgi:hypothetical protein
MKEAIDDTDLIGSIVGWLDETMTLEGAVNWLLSPNPQFAGQSAVFLLMNGREEDVLAALEDLKLQ